MAVGGIVSVRRGRPPLVGCQSSLTPESCSSGWRRVRATQPVGRNPCGTAARSVGRHARRWPVAVGAAGETPNELVELLRARPFANQIASGRVSPSRPLFVSAFTERCLPVGFEREPYREVESVLVSLFGLQQSSRVESLRTRFGAPTTKCECCERRAARSAKIFNYNERQARLGRAFIECQISIGATDAHQAQTSAEVAAANNGDGSRFVARLVWRARCEPSSPSRGASCSCARRRRGRLIPRWGFVVFAAARERFVGRAARVGLFSPADLERACFARFGPSSSSSSSAAAAA